MRAIDTIIIHCSDSPYGDRDTIDRWHKSRGWTGIGYHYVILNGYPDQESLRLKRPLFARDGELQVGRQEVEVGAHVRGKNVASIGVCLIGEYQFSSAQWETLVRLVAELRQRYPSARVRGHYEEQLPGDPPKSCPNIDMDWLRAALPE